MKTSYVILMMAILMSCSTREKNSLELESAEMTEEELYMHYGLEAPPEVYEFLFGRLKNNKKFNQICIEKTASSFVAIEIKLKDKIVSYAEVRLSKYSPILDSLLIKSFLSERMNFDFVDSQNGYYDFRIDINKLCSGKDFGVNLTKDSTSKARPKLHDYSKEMKNFRIE